MLLQGPYNLLWCFWAIIFTVQSPVIGKFHNISRDSMIWGRCCSPWYSEISLSRCSWSRGEGQPSWVYFLCNCYVNGSESQVIEVGFYQCPSRDKISSLYWVRHARHKAQSAWCGFPCHGRKYSFRAGPSCPSMMHCFKLLCILNNSEINMMFKYNLHLLSLKSLSMGMFWLQTSHQWSFPGSKWL